MCAAAVLACTVSCPLWQVNAASLQPESLVWGRKRRLKVAVVCTSGLEPCSVSWPLQQLQSSGCQKEPCTEVEEAATVPCAMSRVAQAQCQTRVTEGKERGGGGCLAPTLTIDPLGPGRVNRVAVAHSFPIWLGPQAAGIVVTAPWFLGSASLYFCQNPT